VLTASQSVASRIIGEIKDISSTEVEKYIKF
jgi:hypothetical protein